MYQWNSVLCMLILSCQIIKVRNPEKTKQYSYLLTWKYLIYCVCERETTQSFLNDLQKALFDLHNVKVTIWFRSTWNRKGSRIIWKAIMFKRWNDDVCIAAGLRQIIRFPNTPVYSSRIKTKRDCHDIIKLWKCFKMY